MRPTQILSLFLLVSTSTARATPRYSLEDRSEELIVTKTISQTTTICPESTKSGAAHTSASASWGASHHNGTASFKYSTTKGSDSTHTNTYAHDSPTTLSTRQSTSHTSSISATSSTGSTSITSTSQSSSSQTATSTSQASTSATYGPLPTLPTCGPAQPQVVINPSFENDLLGFGDHKSPWTFTGGGSVVFPASGFPKAADGSYQAYLPSNGDGTSLAKQDLVGLVPGTKYTLNFGKQIYDGGQITCQFGGCNLLVKINGITVLRMARGCIDLAYEPGESTWVADTETATLSFEWDCVGAAPGGILIDAINVHSNCTEPPKPFCASVSLPNPYLTNSGDTYTTTCGSYPIGDNLVETYSSVGFETCLNICDTFANKACVGFIFDAQVKECTLLSTITGTGHQDFIDGAVLVRD